jgi:hypothetical protein
MLEAVRTGALPILRSQQVLVSFLPSVWFEAGCFNSWVIADFPWNFYLVAEKMVKEQALKVDLEMAVGFSNILQRFCLVVEYCWINLARMSQLHELKLFLRSIPVVLSLAWFRFGLSGLWMVLLAGNFVYWLIITK